MTEQKPKAGLPSLYKDIRVLILAIDAMLMMTGFGIVGPSMSFYLIALEGGITEPPGPGETLPREVVAQFGTVFGIMLGAFMFTRTLLTRYWGGLSDRIGRRPIMIVGLYGYIALLVMFGMARNWLDLLLIRGMQGVISAMVWPVAEAALMDIVGPYRRGEAMGVYMVASNIGFVLGPGLGGVLYDFCRDVLRLPVPDVFRVPYFIAAVVVVPPAVITTLLLKETAPQKTRIQQREHDSPQISKPTNIVQSGDQPFGTEIMMDNKTRQMMNALYIMSLTNGLAMGIGQSLFQLFLMSEITSDIGLIGVLISVGGAIGVILAVPAGRYGDRKGRKQLAVWGGLGARTSLFILPLMVTIPQTAIVWMTLNALISVSQPAVMAIQADVVPAGLRGKLFGTIQAYLNAGAAIGPLIGGTLFSITSLFMIQLGPIALRGFVIPFWFASMLGIIGVLIFWRYVASNHHS